MAVAAAVMAGLMVEAAWWQGGDVHWSPSGVTVREARAVLAAAGVLGMPARGVTAGTAGLFTNQEPL